MDHLAWDLGNPAGNLTSVVQNGQTIVFHPMKGPMTTQTLKGLNNLSPYHWRGDKANLAAFNSTFSELMGGSEISTSDMNTFSDFLNSILFQHNPNQNLDRTFPTSIFGGNPTTGQSDFVSVAVIESKTGEQTCNTCHTSNPGPGSNRLINDPTATGQPLKTPELRNIYQKLLRVPIETASGSYAVIDGFGLDHDGDIASLTEFLASSIFSGFTSTQKTDIAAYLECFDTGTAPAVGVTMTLTSATVSASSVTTTWSTLEAQAAAGNIDLEVRGTVLTTVHGLLYNPSGNTYTLDTGGTLTHAQLVTLISDGDVMSVMGVYPGTGTAAVGTILP
jgi:hypothetical protein